MRILAWLIRGFLFFTLFAFALNNQQPVTVHWFFGAEWRAPMVIVVLAAFAAGCAIGVLAMAPGRWRRWLAMRRAPAPAAVTSAPPAAAPAATARSGPSTDFGPEFPPREAL